MLEDILPCTIYEKSCTQSTVNSDDCVYVKIKCRLLRYICTSLHFFMYRWL